MHALCPSHVVVHERGDCGSSSGEMSWQRIVAQVVITGTQIVGKAFLQAYRQAAANAGKDAAKAAGGVVKRGQMTESEALDILNLEKTPDGKLPPREELEQFYVKYFEANDPDKGGSYYLQSKFFRANEFLQEQHDLLEAEDAEATGTDAKDGDEGLNK